MIPQINIKAIEIPVGSILLKGDISIPDKAAGLVIFAHGSGSSRLSPRNQEVALYLNRHGIATLLFDLLTYQEDSVYANRFQIDLLSQRLEMVTQWVALMKECKGLPIGYFGASTGAAAALLAARELPQVQVVVSRGGRPDLARKVLPFVRASTLLIVGGMDRDVLKLNQQAFSLLSCEKRLEIVPGATHLFEEAGAMEKVCKLATSWFKNHFHIEVTE